MHESGPCLRGTFRRRCCWAADRMTRRSGSACGRRRLFRYGYRLSRECVGADAVAEIAEGLAVLAVLFEVMQDWHESRHDFVGGHQVFVDEVEPIAEHAAAEENGVLILGLADEA